MQLTPEQREQVRLSLLRYGLGGFTLGLGRQYLSSEGFRGLEADQVRLEIDYLVDKGLMSEASKVVSPEVKRWRTTAAGRDYLAEGGIA